MAVELLLEHVDKYFENSDILDRDSLNLTVIKDKWNEIIASFPLNRKRDVLEELFSWRYQAMVKIFPFVKRKHSVLDCSSATFNKVFFSYWYWQLLTKPFEQYFFNMEIKEKMVDQRDIPVNIVCTAAEENYFAICTADMIYFYRIDDVKKPIYRVEIGLGSTIKSIHFYQNGTSHLIAIVRLENNHLRFFDVKYRNEINYQRFQNIEVNTLCVGTHHKFYIEKNGTVTQFELPSTIDSDRNAISHRYELFRKKDNNEVFYMFSENDKLLVACHVALRHYKIITLQIPVLEDMTFSEVAPQINIDLLKNLNNEIPQILMPVNKIIMSVVDSRLKYGWWVDNAVTIEQPYSMDRRNYRNVAVPITAYVMYANILFIGYEDGYLQLFRMRDPEEAPNLNMDESKLIKLSNKSHPITTVCVSEFKNTLFIVASTAMCSYTIKFSF